MCSIESASMKRTELTCQVFAARGLRGWTPGATAMMAHISATSQILSSNKHGMPPDVKG